MTDRRTALFVAAGLVVAVVVAVGVSQFSSDAPDGLEYVAEEEGFASTAEDGIDAPLAGYGEDLTDNDALGTAVAGLVGVLATFVIGYGVFYLARRARSRDGPETGTP